MRPPVVRGPAAPPAPFTSSSWRRKRARAAEAPPGRLRRHRGDRGDAASDPVARRRVLRHQKALASAPPRASDRAASSSSAERLARGEGGFLRRGRRERTRVVAAGRRGGGRRRARRRPGRGPLRFVDSRGGCRCSLGAPRRPRREVPAAALPNAAFGELLALRAHLLLEQVALRLGVLLRLAAALLALTFSARANPGESPPRASGAARASGSAGRRALGVNHKRLGPVAPHRLRRPGAPAARRAPPRPGLAL